MSIFNSVSFKKLPRNLFNLGYQNKMSARMGDIIPFLVCPTVPGDKFRFSVDAFMRTAPLIAPLMHNVRVDFHFFFVPNRLLWKEWQNFIVGEKNNLVLPNFPSRYRKASGATDKKLNEILGNGQLLDYLGYQFVQTELDPLEAGTMSQLPWRAYWQIIKDYYADENLDKPIAEIDVQDPLGIGIRDWSGLYNGTQARFFDVDYQHRLFRFYKRAWKKDYFTSALPWLQKGEQVTFNLGANAPVHIDKSNADAPVIESPNGVPSVVMIEKHGQWIKSTEDGVLTNDDQGQLVFSTKTNPLIQYRAKVIQQMNVETANGYDGIADLSKAKAISINDLRVGNALQRWLEKTARGGSRYIEQIAAHFGVISSDARLQRAEFLGAQSFPLNFSDLPQLSSTNDVSPLGTLAGAGTAAGKTKQIRKYCEEHGYIIGLMSIVPDAVYSQGIARDLLKKDRMEFYFPDFANLGEQEIFQAEINGKTANPYGVFGYTPRYAEYKHNLSQVHGRFRDSLDFWHLGRKFKNEPVLNRNFVQIDEQRDGLARAFAVEGTAENPVEHFYCYIQNNIRASRLMPKYGTPIL